MRRVTSLGVMMVVSTCVVLGATQARQVMVIPLDAKNVPVSSLTAADVMVFEDGQTREVTAVEKATEPLSVMILLDTAKAPMGTVDPTRDMRQAVQTFVKTVAASGVPTSMAIMEYAGAGTVLRSFTEKVEDVEKAAGRLVPSQRSNSVLLETLPDAARDLGKRPGPRRAIVILDRGAMDVSQVRGERISESVRASGATVWAVTVPSQSTSPNKELVLDTLTEATGGMRLTAVSTAALEEMMRTVATALVSQYVVTYSSAGGTSKSVVPVVKTAAKSLRAPWVK